VPIMFVNCDVGQVILVFTGSAKKADDTILALIGTLLDERIFVPALLSNIVAKTPNLVLTAAAKGEVIGEEDAGPVLEFFDSALLKGAGKQTIRVQHKDIGSPEVQNILAQNFNVAKLGVTLSETQGEDPTCAATISDKLVVTGLKVSEVKAAEKGAEAKVIADTFFNNLWLTATECKTFVNTLIAGMGGLIEREEKQVGSQDAPAKIGSGNGDAAADNVDDDLEGL
jgi:DNA recombination-dependent growth factor C